MRTWILLCFVAASCGQSAGEEHPASDAGGHGGTGGIVPFDAAVGGAHCDASVEASAKDAETDASDPECTGVAGGVSYTNDIEPIMNGCTGEICHQPWTYATLVKQKALECCDGRVIVAPGEPSASYIMDKLLGKNLCGGVRMPAGKPPLPDAQRELILRWICEGAPSQ